MTSDSVLTTAAESLNMKPKKFGEPNIKLIDEASLILFEMKGGRPNWPKGRRWR